MFIFQGGIAEKAEGWQKKGKKPYDAVSLVPESGNDRFMAPVPQGQDKGKKPPVKIPKSKLEEIHNKVKANADAGVYKKQAKAIVEQREAAAEKKENQVLASRKEVVSQPIYDNYSIKVNHYVCPVSTLSEPVTVLNLTDFHFQYYSPSKAPPYKQKADDKEWIGKEGDPKYWYTNVQDRSIINCFDGTCKFLSELIDMLRAKGIKPDIIILGGDFTAKGIRDLHPEALKALSSLLKDGAKGFFILGNNDMAEAEEIKRLISSAGFKYLSNSCEMVDVRGTKVLVSGINPYQGPAEKPSAPLSAKPALRIVAIHDYDKLPAGAASDADYVPSGHYHYGEAKFGARIYQYIKSSDYREKVANMPDEIAILPTPAGTLGETSGGVGRYLKYSPYLDDLTGPLDGCINIITFVGTGAAKK